MSRDTRARSRELSLMSCTCGSMASATVSGIEHVSARAWIEIECDRRLVSRPIASK